MNVVNEVSQRSMTKILDIHKFTIQLRHILISIPYIILSTQDLREGSNVNGKLMVLIIL